MGIRVIVCRKFLCGRVQHPSVRFAPYATAQLLPSLHEAATEMDDLSVWSSSGSPSLWGKGLLATITRRSVLGG